MDQFIGTLADFVFDPDMLGEQIYYVLPGEMWYIHPAVIRMRVCDSMQYVHAWC